MTGSLGRGLLLTVACCAAARSAGAQEDFPQTLRWGSGLLDIPVAFVPPETGDFGLSLSMASYHMPPVAPDSGHRVRDQGAFSVAFFGRLELGMSAYSTDPEQGFFWQGLLVNQDDFHNGLWNLIPSIAVGMRNIGPYSHIDRYGLGYSEVAVPGATAPTIAVDSLHRAFSTGNTLYGVATKSFMIGSGAPGFGTLGLSLSVGYGNGLFSNHGDLPVADYSSAHTGGLFFGVNADVHPSVNTLITLMAENDAWDDNVGVEVSYRGLHAEIAATGIGAHTPAGTAGTLAASLYNYTKVAFSLGWQGNLLGVVRGNLLAGRAAQLDARRKRLLAQVRQRDARIAQLQTDIANYQSEGSQSLDARRAQLEEELRAEQAELDRLNAELRRIQQQSGGGGGGGGGGGAGGGGNP